MDDNNSLTHKQIADGQLVMDYKTKSAVFFLEQPSCDMPGASPSVEVSKLVTVVMKLARQRERECVSLCLCL
jgi:hypothetical protein